MAPSVDLSIPYEAQASSKSSSLESQVRQIITQKGPFRHVSEQSLQAEINDPAETTDENESKQEAHDALQPEQTTEARLETLWKNRNEMIQRLDYAQNEILSALDFVSLLLSNHSEAAKASMSPALKEATPTGSIDMRRVRNKDLSEPSRNRLQAVSRSWKAQKFESAAEHLDEASKRLNEEAILQSKYWQQIAALKAQGWPVSRLPDDSRAIVVHYGSSEAAAPFRNRGFALLLQEGNGELRMAQSTTSHTNEVVEAIVLRNGVETGRSSMKSSVGPSEGIEQELINARETLIDQELFHEIGRESRIIANQGVALRSSAVDILISENCTLRIEKRNKNAQVQKSPVAADDTLANFVLIYLRMLLTGEHEASYQRRSSQKPSPLSPNPRPTPEYALLRPLIAHLRHHALVAESLKILKCHQKILAKAELTFSISRRLASNDSSFQLDVASLRRPAISYIEVNLPSGKIVTLRIETYLASPLFGTQFSADPLEYDFATLKMAPTHSLTETEAYIEQAITLDITHFVAETKVEGGRWVAIRPQSGELVLSKSNQKMVKLRIQSHTAALTLLILQKGNTTEEAFQWAEDSVWHKSGVGPREESQKTFTELVSELSLIDTWALQVEAFELTR